MILNSKINKVRKRTAKGKSLYGGLLEGNNSQVIHIIGDSMSNGNDEWPYLMAQKIATEYPDHNVKYKLFNISIAYATGGTTTTLVDSAKNWIVNQYAGGRVFLIYGVGAGTDLLVLSNTATTLTFATQSFTPNTTTAYILDPGFGAWINLHTDTGRSDRYVENKHFTDPAVSNYRQTLADNEVPITDPDGDIDVTLRFSLDSWSTSGIRWIFTKRNISNFCWGLYCSANDNRIYFVWSPNGAGGSIVYPSSFFNLTTLGFANGQAYWVRVKLCVADPSNAGNYTLRYYTSPTGAKGSWTLHSSSNGAFPTSVYAAAAADYYLGGNGNSTPHNAAGDVNGKFYEVLIRDGIEGPVVNPQPIESWHRFAYSDGLPSGSFGGAPTVYIYCSTVAGWGTREFKIPAMLKAAAPKSYGALVLVALGGNDYDTYYNLGTPYKADLDTLHTNLDAQAVSAIKIFISKIPFISPPFDAIHIQARIRVRKILMAYAQKNSIDVIDTYSEFMKIPNYAALVNPDDGVHPIGEGKTALFNIIWNELGLI